MYIYYRRWQHKNVTQLAEFDERKVVGHGAYGAVYEVRMNGTPCIAKKDHDIL